MTIGRFTLRLNSWTFIEYLNGKAYFYEKGDGIPTKELPWVTFSLRFPSVTLPVQTRNEFGEWERLFTISAPTLIQIGNCSGISWEGHLMVLGFGISIIWQYGY